jgi:hypothetical protein
VAGTQIDGGWQEELLARWDEYADTRLGPQIRDDAKRFCPVDTGSLRDSIEHVVATDHTLLVSAYGSDERWYAAWVELGHRVAHGRNGPVGPEIVPPQPFLRPALLQQRNG